MTVDRTCRLVTLGCKVNQYDTQLVKEMLEASGFREAKASEPAQVCVVNTCTVTAEADAKARQIIRQLARSNPGTALVVMGCYATRDPEALRRLPRVARVITDKQKLAEEFQDFGVRAVPRGIRRFDGHQRAFVKVQDGCILNCTFCIIPSVRPGLRSRPPEEILHEVRQLVDRGYHEIVLTGIHLGHYGIDLSRGRPRHQWMRLWHLLERLSALPGAFRIRLSSLEAAEVREDLIQVLAGNPRVCPHLHLCLQSGSDRVLLRMKRRYRARSFQERCRRLRQALDLPAITTDIIVGFPGETEEDFQATCRVAREVGFAGMHVFPFSARRTTPAAAMPDQVPARVIAERKERLAELDRELSGAYLRQLIGRRLEVLVEGVVEERIPQPAESFRQRGRPALPDEEPHATYVSGTACRKARVVFPGRSDWRRQLITVRALEVQADRIRGEFEELRPEHGSPAIDWHLLPRSREGSEGRVEQTLARDPHRRLPLPML
jgi:threonylcarbamoyladenosine tRNA methylthiotransferase MtaB